MADFSIPTRLTSVVPQGRIPLQQIDAPAGAFGANPQQLAIGAQQLERASDVSFDLFQKEAKEANDTRVQQLNDDFVKGQNALLFTNDDAFYRQTGENAIKAAVPTTEKLRLLKDQILDQAGNSAQKTDLAKRLGFHLSEVDTAMGRHVATQSTVWKDAVTTGKVATAATEMTLNNNDPQKVELHAMGGWQTEYDRSLEKTGSPEAATAAANAWRSNAFKSSVTALAVNHPGPAQRMVDSHRDWLDATDYTTVTATIKDSSQKRRTQDIVGLVTATGGVSPDYNAKVGGVENAGSYQGENRIGALGKYQFTKDTYTGLAQQTEWGKGKSQAEVRALLLDPRGGPARQDELQGKFRDGSTAALSRAGVAVNDLTLYTTHFLGQGAGPELLKLPDDTPLQPALLKAHGGDAAYVQKVNDSNPFLAKVQTVGDLKALLAQKIGAPQSMATGGSPQKPNLDAMLSSGLAMAGDDPDLRDRVAAAIKTDYATKAAVYNAQTAGLEKQAYAHIDAGGTLENLPSQVRGALDADGLTKVAAYEDKKLEKRRKENADAAGKGLATLESLQQLTVDDVRKQEKNLPANEFRSWLKTAEGRERTDDNPTVELLQRGLGTRDMRDDIFAAHTAGDISSETRNGLLDKNATFLKEGAPASPYKLGHDYVMRSLDPGLMGAGISRQTSAAGIKEFDQYVAQNPQRDGETPEQYGKRLDSFAQDTVKRHSIVNTQELAISQPVPAHTTFNRADMTGLPKPESTKKIISAYGDLSKRFADGQITEDQFNADAIVLQNWQQFVTNRKDAAPGAPRR